MQAGRVCCCADHRATLPPPTHASAATVTTIHRAPTARYLPGWPRLVGGHGCRPWSETRQVQPGCARRLRILAHHAMGIAQELPHACAVQSGKSRQLPWCRGTQPPMRTCDGVSSNPNCPRTDVETTEGRAAKCGTQLCHCNVSGGKILRLFGHRLAGVDWLAARCAHSVIWHGWHPRGRAIVSYLTPARGPSFVQPCQWSRYAAATLRAGRRLSPRTPSAYARRACLCHSCHRPRAPALCHARPPTSRATATSCTHIALHVLLWAVAGV